VYHYRDRSLIYRCPAVPLPAGYFISPKNYFNLFSRKVGKTPFFDCVVIEGQNPEHRARSPPPFSEPLSAAPSKGGEQLKPADGNRVRHEFDSYCKKVLKYNARNHFERLRRQSEQEVTFSELSESELASLAVVDVYPSDETVFDVQGEAVTISDDELAEALTALPQDRRDIVLMSYFTGLTDREIASRMDMARSTVQHRRTSTLKELRRRLEEIDYE
jgi:RNA polymerase sigma factor (sigma-70 family)